VLLHGRGANEHDLYPLLDALDPQRRLHGYTPRAPLSLTPGGAHWYAVPRVGFPDPQTFAAGYLQLTAWLDSLPFEPEQIRLGGFSQGAVMSHAAGLGRGRPRPAAVVAFSGFIPTVDGWELDLETPLPPVAMGHGAYDDIIPVEFAREAHRLLGDGILYREYPLGHSIDPGFVDEVAAWLP
jgi:phospholipase/carboxylesterase